MKSFVHYNPNVVAHKHNHHLQGMAQFSEFFRMFSPTVVMLDRSETIRLPVRTTSLFPVPAMRPFSKSFEDVCNDRATELLSRADRLGVRLCVFYSGGIDSTLVLISLLKNATRAQRSNIVVLLSDDSINESPTFYRDHIQGRLQIESSVSFPYVLGGRHLIVNGEHSDQLFGSDMLAKLITRYDASVIHQRYNRDLLFGFFNPKTSSERVTHFYLDTFERLRVAAPISLHSNQDVLWWINFVLKWQSVYMRMLTFVAPRNAERITTDYLCNLYAPFYNTEEFQLWSMNNLDKRIRDTWASYKWLCKDIIYDYTRDGDYRDNKIKRGSLFNILRQLPAYNFIRHDMHFQNELNPLDYYAPENDFS